MPIQKFKKVLALSIAVSFAFLAAFPAWASRATDEDFGLWNVYELEAKRGKAKYKLAQEFRYREAGGLYYFETRAGASYDALKKLTLGGDYVQARQQKRSGDKDRFFWESRPRIYATPKVEVRGFTLENRNLLEFRFKYRADDTLRYRNMSTVTAPWKWTRFEFQPYISDELFIESDRNGLVENRFYDGWRMHFWKNIYGSLYYLRQSQKNNSGGWKDFNILGVGLKATV